MKNWETGPPGPSRVNLIWKFLPPLRCRWPLSRDTLRKLLWFSKGKMAGACSPDEELNEVQTPVPEGGFLTALLHYCFIIFFFFHHHHHLSFPSFPHQGDTLKEAAVRASPTVLQPLVCRSFSISETPRLGPGFSGPSGALFHPPSSH